MTKSYSKKSSCSHEKGHNKVFEHKIRFQLADSLGFLISGTQFWVTLTIRKDGPNVTLQFPCVNFQTGPVSSDDPVIPIVPGGYLYAVEGFLPKNLRPNDLVYRSFLATSNNGMSEPFSFTQAPTTLPKPPSGYIVQITNAGAIVIQASGTFGNIIPPGPQIMLPITINYIVKPKIKLGKNYIIGPGFTNTTQFTGTSGMNGLRDSHFNDAFDNVLGWSWADNSMIADKSNNSTNCLVVTGKIRKDGTLKFRPQVQLTDFKTPNTYIFDTSVAINRTNPNNIIVSYRYSNAVTSPTIRIGCRAVSFDGGKTWPPPFDGINANLLNGPVTPTIIVPNDNMGVKSDKFGNIWYSFSGFNNDPTTPPTFFVSSDQGITFTFAFTGAVPVDPNSEFYDYPQFNFGGDGLGNYGLWYQSSIFNFITGDVTPSVGFFPITGLGQFDISVATFTRLNQLTNSAIEMDLTVSADGRVWLNGLSNVSGAYSYISPLMIVFKSPGSIDQNYAGAWDFSIVNDVGFQYGTSGEIAQPQLGFFPFAAQSIIYDESRVALYCMTSTQSPYYSQNVRISFAISRNNGQTWSDPIDISSSDFANRGFQSMALDAKTGNLIFGFYDGRNDPTFQSVQYFAAVIIADELDELVNKIPLSDPLYTIPAPSLKSKLVPLSKEKPKVLKDPAKEKHARRLTKK